MLNLELVRDAQNVARIQSSGPAAEHHASALPPASLHVVTDPAAGLSFVATQVTTPAPARASAVPEPDRVVAPLFPPAAQCNGPLSKRSGRAAACAVAPAGNP
jgi:hypothetical protein